MTARIKAQKKADGNVKNPYHCFSHCQLASSGLGGASSTNNTLKKPNYAQREIISYHCNVI